MKWPTILTSRDLRPSFRLCNLYDEGVFVLQNRFRYMLLGIAVILFGIACSSLKILEWVALLSPFLGLGLVLFACFFDMDNYNAPIKGRPRPARGPAEKFSLTFSAPARILKRYSKCID